MAFLQKYALHCVVVLMVISLLTRFYNLNWGAPYYFHPDERNIASSVSQLRFPEQMNPHFFAYGSLPIYTIYKTGVLMNSLSYCWSNIQICLPTDISFLNVFQTPTWQNLAIVSFEQSIIISRFFSALFSVLLIFVIYKIGELLDTKSTGVLATFLATTSVGFIQFAHFGTFEMWLTFFGALLVYYCMKIIQTEQPQYFLYTAFILGILVAVKVSSLVLLPLPLLAFLLSYVKKLHPHRKRHLVLNFGRTILVAIPLLFFAGAVYLFTNPFIYFDFKGFQGGMNYESSVALGTLPVFYTQGFYNTTPVIYQLLHVYPFLLNPLLTMVFIVSFAYFTYAMYKTKNALSFIVYAAFLLLLLTQAFFFVKWTRYMVPTLPFIYVISAVGITRFIGTTRRVLSIEYIVLSILAIVCCVFAFAYIHTVLASPDTRLTARNWLRQQLPATTPVMSEVYDLGIVPFNEINTAIVLCNIYDLEINPMPCNGKTLSDQLESSEYIILPSQRLLQTRILNKEKYPQGNQFYTSLFTGEAGYSKIYETPCSIWCKILYVGNPIFAYEQTASVFDRPMVYIFKKK